MSREYPKPNQLCKDRHRRVSFWNELDYKSRPDVVIGRGGEGRNTPRGQSTGKELANAKYGHKTVTSSVARLHLTSQSLSCNYSVHFATGIHRDMNCCISEWSNGKKMLTSLTRGDSNEWYRAPKVTPVPCRAFNLCYSIVSCCLISNDL